MIVIYLAEFVDYYEISFSLDKYLYILRSKVRRHNDDVKHSMDKSFIIFESLFYTFTPFFIVQEVLLKPVAAQNLLVHWME